MWLAGGLAVVASGVVFVVLALLEDDRRGAAPVARGPATVEELRVPALPVAWRGYERGHVEALLARAALAVEEAGRDDPTVDPGPEGPSAELAAGPAAPPSFLAASLASESSDAPAESGEELEHGGGDDTRGLDG